MYVRNGGPNTEWNRKQAPCSLSHPPRWPAPGTRYNHDIKLGDSASAACIEDGMRNMDHNLYSSVALIPCASHLSFQSLSFLICKMGMKTILCQEVVLNIKWDKHLGRCLHWASAVPIWGGSGGLRPWGKGPLPCHLAGFSWKLFPLHSPFLPRSLQMALFQRDDLWPLLEQSGPHSLSYILHCCFTALTTTERKGFLLWSLLCS